MVSNTIADTIAVPAHPHSLMRLINRELLSTGYSGNVARPPSRSANRPLEQGGRSASIEIISDRHEMSGCKPGPESRHYLLTAGALYTGRGDSCV